jgi:uncharacterized membrane protein
MTHDEEQATSQKSKSNIQKVAITDIEMPFVSMVIFMIKWAIAAIPAIIILAVILTFVFSMMSSILLGVVGLSDAISSSHSASSYSDSKNVTPLTREDIMELNKKALK